MHEVSILAIIVLYRMQIKDCEAFQSLLASKRLLGQDPELKFKVLLYDNSPEQLESISLPDGVLYHRAGANHGIAAAYNFALKMALTEHFEWLLTLDQDSVLPATFLKRITDATKSVAEQSFVAGVVPQVFDKDVFLSPHYVSRGVSRRLPQGFTGIYEGEISAINSGTIWRTNSLGEIGGFNKLFWLDGLDHWLYHSIFRAGKLVYIIGDLQIYHALSLVNRNQQLSPDRFDNILAAEGAFCDLYKERADQWRFCVWLAKLLCRGLLRRRNWNLNPVTWKHLMQRLFLSRNSRIEAWKRLQQERIASFD